MKAWNAEKQRWEPSPAPLTGRPNAMERGLRVAAAALGVTVLATVTFGGGLLLFRDDEALASETSAGASGYPDATGTDAGATGTGGTDTGTDTPSASTTASGPPPGFVEQQDVQGFSVQVRDGWERREEQRAEGVVVYYETAAEDGVLQVYRISEPGYTPYDALVETDRLVGKVDGYERIGLDQVDGSGDAQTAVLEYRVPRENGTVRRSLLRAFVGDDGVRWVVLVAGPDDEWDALYAESAEVAAASFCPLGHCPATP